VAINFKIEQKLKDRLGRAGVITTPHGEIQTPAFIVVGTKASVKSLSPEQVSSVGAQAVLANTYHLYLEPGADIVAEGGGVGKFMNWSGPTFTDSGGFQVLSLGAAYGSGLNKFVSREELEHPRRVEQDVAKLAKVDDEGVTFRSHLDGSEHRFTPESSMAIQHQLGADIIFAFDECTSPLHGREYQEVALRRTHEWAARSLAAHNKLDTEKKQSLWGVVQGGSYKELREQSAKAIADLGFEGFGIGGSYTKEEIGEVMAWVNQVLPEEKPRHLLGIGEPLDFFIGVEQGADTFDCVAPARMARNGTVQTATGRLNLLNAQYRRDFSPIESACECYTCKNYTKAYLAHLFRAKEMFGATLATIHNLYFSVNLVKKIRQSILDGNFAEYKEEFLGEYQG
jgi:queuine tRNA-ribosyltransferase